MHLFCNNGTYCWGWISAPANIQNAEGLALSHRLIAAKYMAYNISLTSVNKIIKYDLQLKCMLVCCRCPLPGSRSIVPVLTTFFIIVFSSLTFYLFSENIILIGHVYQMSWKKTTSLNMTTIISAVSQLLIKCPCSTGNPTVEQIYMMQKLSLQYQTIFIHQLNNFYTGNIWIYSAMSNIFVQIWSSS